MKSRKHLSRVAALGCIVCLTQGYESPAEIHHVRHGGEKRDDYKTIPLCPRHHRNGPLAVHVRRRSWERMHGNQARLVEQVYFLLNEPPPAHVREWMEA